MTETSPIDVPEPKPRANAPDRPNRATFTYRHYTRWSKMSRLSMIAFLVAAGVLLVWLIPWFPSGLDASDYTPQFAFTVYLLAAVTGVGLLALVLRELARRDREALMVLGTVYDEETGLHNRSYLNDRLALEASRAERLNYVFSLIIFQIRLGKTGTGSSPTLPKVALQKVAETVERQTHTTDLVALLSDSELAVLAIGVDQQRRKALQERLRHAIAEELPGYLSEAAFTDVKAGVATYGVDGKDAATLVQAARTSASLGVPERARAA
jgi:diguanylate cyclase (GGDEF)-like protein